VTFHLKVKNESTSDFSGIQFVNTLPELFTDIQADDPGFTYDKETRLLMWKDVSDPAQPLPLGKSINLTYTVTVDSEFKEAEIVDTASLSADNLKEPLSIETTLMLLDSDGSDLTMLDANGGDAQGLNGKVKVHLPKKSLDSPAAVFIRDSSQEHPSSSQEEPWLVFELGLRAPQEVVSLSPVKSENAIPAAMSTPSPAETSTSAPDTTPVAQENDQATLFEPVDASFKVPVELSVSLDGIADLSTLGADITPFLVTLDEETNTWVRVPLKKIDREANQVTAEIPHFSTWGVGLGSSFPTNSANILLFDSAYPSLYTGRSKYSLPIWTPAGRNGIQPDLALSYSSGSVDGVLGDVQAPWTGIGWSIDTAEIARKITNGGCSPCGGGSYGYENSFVLLLNGASYELLPDGSTPDRYHTREESFLYIQRHNDSLGNNSPSAQNATGEWWEVVEKDGTRWRLGWNADSEQLAAMKGYPGTNPPTGAWATLGYAGNEPNVAALRWRVDQVKDIYGNQMKFVYHEESRTVAGTSASYDRAS
jgi:hypothetical protein